MNRYDLELAQKIRTTIGVALNEPTELQLSAIKRELKAVQQSGKTPGYEELKRAVRKFCHEGPILCLESADNSDLNTVLMMALQATPTKTPR